MFRSLLLSIFLCSLIVAGQSQSRQKLAILNLKNANGVTLSDAELISDRLRNELFSTGMVDMMERDQMQEVLKEQGFQQSGTACTDEGCMVEIGKLLGVSRLVTGSVGKLGSLYMINVRSIDIQSGKIDKVVSRDIKGSIENLVGILSEIAQSLAGIDPLQAQAAKANNVSKINKDMQVPDAVQPNQDPNSAQILPCTDNYYMEKISLSSAQIGFPPSELNFEELNETLADAIEEALDKDVVVGTNEQITKSKCQTRVFRIKLMAYKTDPSINNQVEGTAKIMISLYKSPTAATPLVSVIFEETGSRHWGNSTPFINAFDELADTIEEDLESQIDKFLK